MATRGVGSVCLRALWEDGNGLQVNTTGSDICWRKGTSDNQIKLLYKKMPKLETFLARQDPSRCGSALLLLFGLWPAAWFQVSVVLCANCSCRCVLFLSSTCWKAHFTTSLIVHAWKNECLETPSPPLLSTSLAQHLGFWTPCELFFSPTVNF